MDALRSALPLARLLLALAEHARSASLLVRSGSRLAELQVSQGRVVRVDGVECEPLGDALLRDGALDQERHGAALLEQPQEGPVGEWLVQVGAAPREAVQQALREQLTLRVARLFSWAQPHVTLVAGEAHTHSEVSADLVRAVWQGLFALAQHQAQLAQHEARFVAITARGVRLLSQLRRAGVEVDAALRGPLHPEARVARSLLVLLGALAERETDADSYSLLLRKQREIRRSASPAELLDLPERSGPAEARRAFRRLASRLHPDRFHGDAPELFELSSDVLRALSRAEALLRGERKAG